MKKRQSGRYFEHNLWKRLLLLCAAVIMAWTAGGAAIAESLTVPQAEQEIRVYPENGAASFIAGAITAEPVQSLEDAEKVLSATLPQLGGSGQTQFAPRRTLTDPAGNVYYVFQQVLDDTLVQGGTVKIITDRNGKMLGLTGSVIADLPAADSAAEASVSETEAEQLVLQHERDAGNAEPSLVEGMTTRIILPVNRELDVEAENYDSRYVWVVYTTNPKTGGTGSSMPYLAHYVTLAGGYLYSLPTILPGDAAGTAGYDASYLFEFMEPAEYTGFVDWSDGTEHEITVPLMRDTRTGMYYLGNLEHKIIVADCWEFLYNHGRVVAEYSPDNREWDQVGLMSLYNYCRAFDYFREIGWIGPDGEGTPIIVLKDFCDEDHQPVDNAAYAGKFYGWEVFLSSSVNDLSQCLDVCCHEFTHGVTENLMTYNAYMNDFGAINEAVSDIHGNLCELMAQDTEDTEWVMAEHSLTPIRSMSDPNRFQQPGYVWDVYYRDQVKEPTDANDQGGVHYNSSLLSRIAYLLCTEGGMTLEEARMYWFTAGCAMVPGSDYAQMRELLPWVLKIAGLEKYEETLHQAIEDVRLGDTILPETLDADKALLTLDLPDNEVFNNGKWLLCVASFNLDRVTAVMEELDAALKSGNTEGYPKLLQELITDAPDDKNEDSASDRPGLLSFLMDVLRGVGEESSVPEDKTAAENAETPEERKEKEELTAWLREKMQDVFYSDMGSAGADGHVIRMMSKPGRTIPMLTYMSVKPGSAEVEQMKTIFLLNGKWYDMTWLLAGIGNEEDMDLGALLAEFLQSDLFSELMTVLIQSNGLQDILNALTLNVQSRQTVAIPTAGLDKVDLTTGFAFSMSSADEVNNRKSRPRE